MKEYDVAIIGGGASGLACAVQLVKSGKKLKIAIIEPSARLGKKLSQTGNGQGNVSNTDMTAEHFFGGNKKLAESIACSGKYDPFTLFDCLFSADEKGRVYPAGRQASALGDSLIRQLTGVEIITAKVTDIEKGFTLTLSDGSHIKSRFAALCTGGKAQKQFNTDGSAYSLALKFGHKLTALYPSLVQLKTPTEHIKTLKGIRADCEVTAVCGKKRLKTVRGDVIFTDYGVSGNAVFSISPYCTDKSGVVLCLAFLPDFSADFIEENLRARIGTVDVRDLLSGSLHNQVGRAIINRAGGDIKNIVSTLKNFELPVLGTLGFDYAQVTRGGIDTADISEELESKLCKGLFFAGEAVDVDGDCGGYNLQWAFTSGMAVADGIIKNYDKKA